jgi:hypothetical protein
MVVTKLIVPADQMMTLARMIAGDGRKLSVADELLAAMPTSDTAN